MPRHWRKGYRSQVMTHLINLAFKYLVYTSMIAYVEPNNIACIKLIKKLYTIIKFITSTDSISFKAKCLLTSNLYKQKLYKIR